MHIRDWKDTTQSWKQGTLACEARSGITTLDPALGGVTNLVRKIGVQGTGKNEEEKEKTGEGGEKSGGNNLDLGRGARRRKKKNERPRHAPKRGEGTLDPNPKISMLGAGGRGGLSLPGSGWKSIQS